jgi:hypothetical protein
MNTHGLSSTFWKNAQGFILKKKNKVTVTMPYATLNIFFICGKKKRQHQIM